MTKEELIELVTKICNPKLPEEELNEYVYQFNNSGVPHPSPSDLIFLNFRNLTPKEIVEIALNYREEK
ncbi:bacteriocin immunity protein [Bacillus sp. 491mf]|uniref:bacteriocin immunity protein n=1 Tax=Bacillus sp. 491mf TaxID=1761755 RepID=UPI000B81665D|nr:bacteriocin immunity protein [Bacillus sp. 491mf]